MSETGNTTMQFLVGTSGYSVKEWKGSFYPPKIAADEMLGFYAERFSTVEINNTFYRMPRASVLESWAAQTPEGFRFVLKVPQGITHRKRLKEIDEPVAYLLENASLLGKKLGALLCQLPPNFKKDMGRLDLFLNAVSGSVPIAFEFRHDSWYDDEVYERLRVHSCTLCIADTDESEARDLVGTANWGYVRLRSEGYTDQQLRDWIAKMRAQAWQRAYVFFKHEDTGTGPQLAARFTELAREGTQAS